MNIVDYIPEYPATIDRVELMDKTGLTDRNNRALIAALVTSLLVVMRMPEETITQVVAVIGAFASIAVYILAEASVDKAGASADVYAIILDDDEPPDIV